MTIKAVFLDFYGTLVHEDDDIIPVICENVRLNTGIECSNKDIGIFWWKTFSEMFKNSWGSTFKTQRELEMESLDKTIRFYQSKCDPKEIIQIQFEHWIKPKIFEDTKMFLESITDCSVYILSNIDTNDILKAIGYHNICVDGVITSEDVKSYKPRGELFLEALKRYGIKNNEVIHIGDSITSDVYGAQTVGIDAVWLNRKGKNTPDNINPKYICKDLREAKRIIDKIICG